MELRERLMIVVIVGIRTDEHSLIVVGSPISNTSHMLHDTTVTGMTLIWCYVF